MESLPGGRGDLLGVIHVPQLGIQPVVENTGGHDQRTGAAAASGLVDTGDGTQTTAGQGRFQCQSPALPGHADPTGKHGGGTSQTHPTLMSGEETVPIRLNGRMIACTFPMIFSSGIDPWNSSPMWNRESAELLRLSPITQ